MFLEVQLHSLEVGPLLQVQLLTCYSWFRFGFYVIVHVIVLVSMSFSISFSFSILINLSSSLWDRVCFFILHFPCRLTTCFCLLQFVSSFYFSDNGPCCLYSMVEVIWIGWLLISWVLLYCLGLRLTTLRRMYQSCFWLCVALTWLNIGHYHRPCMILGFS